jgi:hypothetical protein
MRTPEEMARRYADEECTGNAMYGDGLYAGFLAGYKAANQHAHAALEEAEARHEAYVLATEENFKRLEAKLEQLADADKVMTDSCEHILDMEKMVDVNGWISVHARLPADEREVFITDGLTVKAARHYKYGGWGVTLGRGNKYWMEKPELPEEK